MLAWEVLQGHQQHAGARPHQTKQAEAAAVSDSQKPHKQNHPPKQMQFPCPRSPKLKLGRSIPWNVFMFAVSSCALSELVLCTPKTAANKASGPDNIMSCTFFQPADGLQRNREKVVLTREVPVLTTTAVAAEAAEGVVFIHFTSCTHFTSCAHAAASCSWAQPSRINCSLLYRDVHMHCSSSVCIAAYRLYVNAVINPPGGDGSCSARSQAWNSAAGPGGCTAAASSLAAGTWQPRSWDHWLLIHTVCVHVVNLTSGTGRSALHWCCHKPCTCLTLLLRQQSLFSRTFTIEVG